MFQCRKVGTDVFNKKKPVVGESFLMNGIHNIRKAFVRKIADSNHHNPEGNGNQRNQYFDSEFKHFITA